MSTPPPAPRRMFAAAGAVAGVAGVALSVGFAWALQSKTNALVAVASVVRDHTPGALAARLISMVGHADKPLLVSGTVVILLALCAGAGVVGRRRVAYTDAAFLVLAAVGLLAVRSQPHDDTVAWLSVLIGFVVWVVVFWLLAGQLQHAGRPESELAEEDGTGSRRRFLAISGGVAAVSAFALVGGHWAGRGRQAVENARKLLRLPIARGSVPAGAAVGVDGIAPWRTPDGSFYQVSTTLTSPTVLPSTWRLRIHGMVDHEMTLTYNDLVARRLTQAWLTLCCVSNEVGGDLVGNAYWSGVPVRELLAEAGVHRDADAVKQTSYDGWTCGTPLEALTDGRNALLALGMNGRPLPVDHGFPVRMVVPGLYGYVSATKWLVDLEVTRFDRFQGYWTQEGWSEKGPVKTESRVDVPRDNSGVKSGTVAVGGVAWAQHTGISRVEYQLDGQAWAVARLGRVPGNDTWVQWSGQVQVDRGGHELRVRATDRSGYTQTAARADVVPNGATGWHTISFHAD